MFIREFSVIDSATSAKQLKLRLKDNELEQYGKAFTPEYVYEVIRHRPRFSTMRVSRTLVRHDTTLIYSSVDISKMPKSS
jgi:ubiquitin carboxyl-terminal hydrolase 10